MKQHRRIPAATRLVLLAALGLLCAALPANAQLLGKTRVTILPLPSESSAPQVATIRNTVTDTIALTLQLSGDFSVTRAQDGEFATADEYLANTTLGSVDRVVTIQAEQAGGTYTIDTAVVDPVDGAVVTSRSETIRSVMFLFDSVDLLVPDLLEEMVGRRITFGALHVIVDRWSLGQVESLTVAGRSLTQLVPAEVLEEIPAVQGRVLVDDIPVGEIGQTAERILSGRHRVTVHIRRDDTDIPILDRRIEVMPNQTEEIAAAVPLLTEPEARQLGDALAEIDLLLERAKAAPVSGDEIEEVFAMAYAALAEVAAWAPPIGTIPPALGDLAVLARVYALQSGIIRNWDRPSETLVRDWAELTERVASLGSGPFTEVAQDILNDIGAGLPELWSLSITQRLEEESLATIRAEYRDMESALQRFEVYAPPWVATDRAVLDAIWQEHQTGRNERPGLYRLLGYGGAGLGLAGVATLAGSYLLLEELAVLDEEYRATTNPTRALDLHNQIESQTAIFNGLVYGGGASLALGTGSIVAGQIAQNRDLRRPDRLLKERLNTYFAGRIDLGDEYRSAVNRGRATVPVEGFASALNPTPDGLILDRPVDAPEEGTAAEPTLPEGAGDEIPIVEYPWGSIDATTLLQMQGTGGLKTEWDIWTIGATMYSYGRVATAVSVSAGLGRTDAYMPTFYDEFAGVNANNQPKLGAIVSAQLGNRWRSLSVGPVAAFDGTLRPIVGGFVAYRRVAGVAIPFGEGRAGLMFQYSQPISRSSAYPGALERERTGKPSQSVVVPWYTVGWSVSAGGFVPSLDGLSPRVTVGSGLQAQLQMAPFELGAELRRPIGDSWQLGIGTSLRIDPNGFTGVVIEYEPENVTYADLGSTFSAHVVAAAALGLRAEIFGRFGFSNRYRTQYQGEIENATTEIIERARLPEKAGFPEYWLETGLGVTFGGRRTAVKIDLGPRWTIIDFSEYWETSLQTTAISLRIGVSPLVSADSTIQSQSAGQTAVQVPIGKPPDQFTFAPKVTYDTVVAPTLFGPEYSWQMASTGLTYYRYGRLPFGAGLLVGGAWARFGEDRVEENVRPGLYGQVIVGDRWAGPRVGILGGSAGGITAGGYPFIAYKRLAIGFLPAGSYILALHYSHPLSSGSRSPAQAGEDHQRPASDSRIYIGSIVDYRLQSDVGGIESDGVNVPYVDEQHMGRTNVLGVVEVRANAHRAFDIGLGLAIPVYVDTTSELFNPERKVVRINPLLDVYVTGSLVVARRFTASIRAGSRFTALSIEGSDVQYPYPRSLFGAGLIGFRIVRTSGAQWDFLVGPRVQIVDVAVDLGGQWIDTAIDVQVTRSIGK